MSGLENAYRVQGHRKHRGSSLILDCLSLMGIGGGGDGGGWLCWVVVDGCVMAV